VRRRRAQRQRQALELHDNIVQGLVAIHWALEAGDVEQARGYERDARPGAADDRWAAGGRVGVRAWLFAGDVATAPLEAAGPAAPDGGH
jgi:hypothetical protein